MLAKLALVPLAIAAEVPQLSSTALNATALKAAEADCNTFKDCMSCTNASTWTGSHCRWCNKADDMACHAEGSIFNKCSAKEQITDPIECPGASGKLPHGPLPPELRNESRVRMHEAYAAYCPAAKIENWSCKWCAKLGSHKVWAVAVNESMHAQAYVATAAGPPQRIVVGFRGTTDIKNWIQNIKFFPEQVPWMPDGIQAHRGFVETYQAVRPPVMNALKNARADCPDCEVHLAGHSLGGALAVLCATDLVSTLNVVPQVSTFGCPRTGDAAFSTWYADNVHKVKTTYRMVHKKDLVPHVPTNDMGFHHVSREIWQQKDGDDGYVMCDNSGEDHGCSWQVSVTDCVIDDHFGYMDEQEGCS
eukprot:TRINITY_DN569_c0_g1_i5.p1 TRINITY_DN569_c0_g1~~TRINITY_DN569_c0_g1_i5.p1  ORF type:complete len:362 (+),score=119.83 TRINITY_DN569_c0_g1_i5:91-1176(+)